MKSTHFGKGMRWKMTVINSVVLIVLLGTLLSFILFQSKRFVEQSVKLNIEAVAQEHANALDAELGRALSVVEYVATSTAVMMKEDCKRHAVVDLVASFEESDDTIYGLGVAFEPNGYDRKDYRFKNSDYGDQTGLFSTYTYTDSDGSIQTMQWREGYRNTDEYLVSLRTKRPYMSPPYVYEEENGREVILMAIAYPIIDLENNAICGVANVDVDLTAFVKRVQQINPYGKGAASVNRYDGIRLACTHTDEIGTRLEDSPTIKERLGSYFEDFVYAVETHEAAYFVAEDFYIQTTPFEVGTNVEGNRFSIAIATDKSIASEKVMKFVKMIGVAFFLVILVGSTVSYAIACSLSKPLKLLEKSIRDLYEGEGDLTKVIDVKGSSEVVSIGNSLNGFIGFLNKIVSATKENLNSLSSTGSDLAASAEESSASVEQIQSNIAQMMKGNRNTKQVMEEVGGILSGVQENLDTVAAQFVEQSSSINESSSAIEEMSASVENVSNATTERVKIAQDLQNKAKIESAEMEKIVDRVQTMQSSAESIREFLTILNNITDQTSLLAMNAAIEAAHAGEAGRGFAVVADEIRKLADGAMVSSKEIEKSIISVVKDIEISSLEVQNAGQTFAEIASEVDNITDAMSETQKAMSEIAVGSRQIMEALQGMVGSNQVLSSGYDQIKESMEINIAMAGKVSNQITENYQAVTEIEGGIKEILQSVQVVKEAGTDNASKIEEVNEKINYFVTETAEKVEEEVIEEIQTQE